MHPLLCATVTAPTMAELRRRRDAVSGADLVEMRLDSVVDPSVAGALEGRKTPVVVTCRPAWEGGQFRGSEEERLRILKEALDAGAEYVDIEWRARLDDLVARSRGRRVVLSAHDFDMVPIDLVARLHAMQSTGAAVVKLAARLTRLSDCIPLMNIRKSTSADQNVVVIGMGEFGAATRILPGRFGSIWAYAGSDAAIGQIPVDTLLNEYGFRSISSTTDVYGIVGRPVAHSVSPAMHNAAIRATRLDEAYSVARRIGAINTIRVDNGRWIGANTDASGFLQPVAGRLPLAGARVSILGTGGAARAVAVALGASGADVSVHGRDARAAEDVAGLVSGKAGPWPPRANSWDLLINCTPIGMHPRVSETP